MGVPRVVRSLSFPVGELPVPLLGLLREFRLIVNKSIRIALREDIHSRVRLARAAYRVLSAEHDVYKRDIPSAFEVALGVLKVYRRRIRKGRRSSIPFMRRLMPKAEKQSYRLDQATGRLRIPIRRGDHVDVDLPVSEWHRSFLHDSAWGLGSLTVIPGKIVLVVRKDAPRTYEPEGAVTLDTNEDSLDGVVASGELVVPTVLPFHGVRQIQEPLPASEEAREEEGRGPEGHASPFWIGRDGGRGIASVRGSMCSRSGSCTPPNVAGLQSSSRTSPFTVREAVPGE